MERRPPSRPDPDSELSGPTRATVVAALARMVVAELEREHLAYSEPLQPETQPPVKDTKGNA
jgi:hypothetical protein